MQAKADLTRVRPIVMRLPSWPRSRALTTGIDAATWALATIAAFVLLQGPIAADAWPRVVGTMLALAGLKAIAARAFGVHLQTWERFGFPDARNVLLAAASAAAVGSLALLGTGGSVGVSAAVPVIDGMLSGLLMFATRGGARHLREVRLSRLSAGRQPSNVLLIGAGDAGSMLAREMLRHPETGMRPIGFIDEDHAKQGRTIASVPVLGRLRDLRRVLDEVHVDEILISIPSADGRTIRTIVETIRRARPEMPYRTMPALHELLSGLVTVNRIREVGIEDLLRRPPVQLNTRSILSYLKGKRVMVTGAGGSIGSELVRQICRFGPLELILFGHGENSIYQLERELDQIYPGVRYHSVIAAVQNVQRLDHVFRKYRPDVVFHTAAHKHVPLMEHNPEEAVFNNVVGTKNLVRLALQHGVSHFVNISTDKAVNPSSIMGASKRMAELIVEDAARDATDGQTFVSVRFGNVLGSRGSAVPIFKSQIQNGGPVTITDPEMVRYFMTIPEATQLVLQASAQGRNGEIYILDMGEPVRVLDLVKDLIRLSGLEPEADIPIVFTGIRPGEKLVEELMTAEERHGRTEHEKIFVAKNSEVVRQELEDALEVLVAAAMRSDGDAIRRTFAKQIHGATVAKSIVDAVAHAQQGARPAPPTPN
jgi:FlaA1/EpsC-like NDP-sugar epimerase